MSFTNGAVGILPCILLDFFINLSDISDNLLEKINIYIEYWKKQENNLKHIEHKKQAYKTIFFSKNIKDKSSVCNNAEQSI